MQLNNFSKSDKITERKFQTNTINSPMSYISFLKQHMLCYLKIIKH